MSKPKIAGIYEGITRRLDYLISPGQRFPDDTLVFRLDDCLIKLRFWAQDFKLSEGELDKALEEGEPFPISIYEYLVDLWNEIAHLEKSLGRTEDQAESR